MKLHLDPRTKLFLILLCVLSAMFAPNLYFQFALVTLIGLLAAFSGKWQYALRGMIAYALICVFTVWCMGVLTGTWRTMLIAFLGLVHKVYACGMLGGISLRDGAPAHSEKADHSHRCHAAVSTDHPGGLALYQGRHAPAGCIADTLGLSEGPGYDNKLYLCAAANSGQQDGGRAVHRLCDPRHRKSEAENLPCKNSNEVSGLSDNGVFCGVSCR